MGKASTPMRQHNVGDFKPSENGFKFPNYFPGLPLPDALANLIDTSKSVHGLCGGMCFTVIDHYKSKKKLPAVDKVPGEETHLYKYLAKRQLASWGVLSSQVLRYAQWMTFSDEKAQAESMESFQELKKRLDENDLTVIGLVYNDIRESLRVWDNHQVLAHGYEELEDGTIRIHLYDPNYPKHDDVWLDAKPVDVEMGPKGKQVQGLNCAQFKGGENIHKVHGFIVVPYDYEEPPKELD